ncbi:IPP transferase-domain-containing protein [Cantharellus anzutake]|uniref:IPP transferase-domain-containing protein n=1 Tax=Cantharellus anzutake TaxID=1750568 RepID=UPI0019084EFF|nr:IPP transferase-domain-containing protein [Cantharellus anzutake]KAF8331952.1 IPP transferase-domain-containing protein [Cantharellus anzutake]
MNSPVIAVVGTTGVGKSKLAVELALSVKSSAADHSSRGFTWKDSRVLNADAMQIYRGLDVITNKMPVEEQCGVDHLLMSIRNAGEDYVVGEWVHDASDLIKECHEHDTIPIVAGGTHYWIQHLLFPERLASDPQFRSIIRSDETGESPELARSLLTLPGHLKSLYEHLPHRESIASISEEDSYNLHDLLHRIDPIMSQRWHWKDSRKVLRSLEIIKENGRLASQVMRDQDTTESLPRYRTLIFWIYAEPSLLDPRLDGRVDQMIKSGLVRELHSLKAVASTSRASEIPTQGIFQSIGYKEFSAYLNDAPDTFIPDPSSSVSPSFLEGVAQMKLATRQYARRQVRWIRNRLIPAVASPSRGNRAWIYLLDANELGETWELNVRDKAVSIMNQFLANQDDDMPDPLSLSKQAAELLQPPKSSSLPSELLSARRKRICEICTKNPTRPIMIEEGKEWRMHVKSRAHRGRVRREQHLATIRQLREEAAERARLKAAEASGGTT